MLDGSDIEIIKEVKKEGERTELNGIRVDWQEEDSEYLPTKINGEQVRTQVWYVDAKEIEPRRSLLKRLQPITSGNVREVLRRNAWGEVLSLMTNPSTNTESLVAASAKPIPSINPVRVPDVVSRV